MKILFRNVTAVTMDPARPVLQNACVAVEGTRIASVGQEHPRGEFDRVIDGQGKALLPGLVNCHTHVPMALLRGYGGGHDLQHWLNDYIFPAEARLDDRCVAAGTALGLAEMIASGTTCIADMYMHTGAVARTVLESGVSANLSCGGVYFGAPEDFSPDLRGLPEPDRPDGGVERRGGRPDQGGRLHPRGVYLQPVPVGVDGRLCRGARTGDARPCV